MKPVYGQDRDTNLSDINNQKITDGNNFIITNKFTNIISEPGNTLLHSVTGVILGTIVTADSFIIFSIDGIYSEIGLYKDDIYTIKLKTQYLNFNINYPIFGEYEYNHKGELISLFSDKHDTSKLLNLDNLPFLLNTSTFELLNSNEIILADQFIPFKSPIFSLKSVLDDGGNLKSGTYYVSIQYKLHDGTFTNNSDLSNPIVIVKSGSGETWENYNGDYDEFVTSKSIVININNIDALFKIYKVNVIHYGFNGIIAYRYNEFNVFGTNTINISDLSDSIVIDINSILVNSLSFNTIGAYTKLQKRIYLASLTTNKIVKYQKYANNITINWVYNNKVSLNAIKGSYKDSSVIYLNKCFMPGEVYAFYIRLINLNSNIKSPAFIISGRDAVLSDLAISTNVEAVKIYSSARKFHIEDTCTIIDSTNGIGTMGYWENENEYFPKSNVDTDNDFNSKYDYNGNLLNGRNLQGTPIKHHKFPSTNYLVRELSGKRIIDTLNDISEADYIKFLSPNTAYNEYKTSATAVFINDARNGYFPDSTTWINQSVDTLYIKLNYDLILSAIQLTLPITETIEGYIKIEHILSDGTITIIDIVNYTPTIIESVSLNLNNVKFVYIAQNEGIKVSMYSACIGTNFSVTFDGSLICEYNIVPIASGDMFGRILGIKLNNIYIPDNIKSEYSHFEILYAERATDSMSVLGTSLLPYYDNNGTVSQTFNKFYSFDLLSSKLALAPTHIKLDYYWDITSIIHNTSTLYSILEVNSIRALDGASYIMNNDSSSSPNNFKHGEYIKLRYKNGSTPTLITTTTDYLMGTLYAFKTNMYKPFTNQKLVRTGILVNINDNYIELPTPTGLLSSLSVTGILNGTYYYKVSVKNNNGWTDISSEVSGTVDGGTTNGTINLTWDIISNIITYRIWRGIVTNSENEYYDTTSNFLVDNGNIIFTSGIIPTITVNPNTNIVKTNIIFGGDTYFNLHGITNINYNLDISTNILNNIVYYLVPEYSIRNIGLRYMSKDIFTVFYPKYNLINNTNSLGLTYNGNIDKNDISGTSYNGVTQTPPNYDSIFTLIVKALGKYKNVDFELFNVAPYYGYNKFYNALNDLQTILIFDPNIQYDTVFENIVYRTIIQSSESLTLDWRTILSNEYVISGIDKEGIVALDNNGLDLLVEHKFGTFAYQYRGELNINKNIVANLGDADIFKQEPFELVPDGIGYVGCQSKFASIRTKFGNIIVDRSQGKIFIYNGKVEEISKFDMRQWFITNLQYNNSSIVNNAYLFDNSVYVLFDNGATINVSATSKIVNTLIDNPYGGLGIICSWDEKYERLILTKVSSVSDSFSIDYYPAIKSWGFKHDFIPTQMFYNRLGLFAILNNGIIKMNSNVSGKFILDNTFVYTTKSSYVDIIFNKNDVFSKRFKSILWKSIVTIPITNDIDMTKTFDTIKIFNYNRYSDKIDLVYQTYDKTLKDFVGNVRLTGSLWKFNDFRDVLKTKNIQVLDRLAIDELKLNVLNNTQIVTNWYDKSFFIDDFIIIRFEFNNTNGNSINVSDVFINSDKLTR